MTKISQQQMIWSGKANVMMFAAAREGVILKHAMCKNKVKNLLKC